MKPLSKDAKEELLKAMEDRSTGMFIVGGKLISSEAHDTFSKKKEVDDLAQEIEDYPKLKESLQKFFDNPDMESYTAKELREMRQGKKK